MHRRVSLKIFYDNKINLIGEKGAEVGVIIEHQEIVKTQKEIFELAWLGAEKFGR